MAEEIWVTALDKKVVRENGEVERAGPIEKRETIERGRVTEMRGERMRETLKERMGKSKLHVIHVARRGINALNVQREWQVLRTIDGQNPE